MNDLKYAFRQLFKNPGFTIVVVLTLGLAIGATTAIFSMINSVLIKPLPLPQSEQIVQIFETVGDGRRNSVSGGAFKDWKQYSTMLSDVAIYKATRRNMTGSGEPENLSGLAVTAGYLSVLGVTPTLGRDFGAGEDALGGNNGVVILSQSFWKNRFNSDPGVIGKVIALDQVPHEIIGVLPPRAVLNDDVQFLAPAVIDRELDTIQWSRGYHWGEVIGRMKSGTSAEAVLAELRTIRQQLNAEYPVWKAEWGLDIASLQEIYSGDLRPTLAILFGTVSLVLLIACANVSNLLLARGTTRAREMAIRASVGASSWQIFRQQLVESAILALAGCVAGILLATIGVRALAAMSTTLPSALHPELDVNVLIFSIVLAGGCGLLFGILPALRASRINLSHALKESERGSTSRSKRRTQSLLVVSEFAFTLVLLIGAGLFLRSFAQLLQIDPGFKSHDTLAFDMALPAIKYSNPEAQQKYIQEVTERISAIPGVEAAGAVTTLPLSRRGRGNYVARVEAPDKGFVVGDDFVSGDYFTAMGIDVLRGRAILPADNVLGAQRVLVIDAGLARDLFASDDPIGKHVSLYDETWEVIGVVAAVRHGALDSDPRPRFYGPRVHVSYPTAAMIVRSSLPHGSLVEPIRKAILSIDPDQPIANIRSLDEALSNSLASQRSTLILLSTFAVVAIALACIGIYGVMSHAVAQRAREMSIRSALGAQRLQIVRMVLLGGMKPSVVGIVVGLVSAFALSRVVESQLFEVKVHDPVVFIASVCLLSIVAALSVLLPARRAASANPMEALRHE